VNSSDANFTPVGTDIRFGLSAIRNVGTNVVASVVATRKAKGQFVDFSDFLRKVDAVVCNKKTVESLIKAGAFDSLGHSRRGLLVIHAEAIDACVQTKRAEAVGQFDLFGSLDGEEEDAGLSVFEFPVPTEEWDKGQRLTFEREMLGLYVSDHPLLGVEHVLAAAADASVAALQTDAVGDGQTVTVAGILSSVTRRVNKAGLPWASAVLEDLEGSVEVLYFPATYAQVGILVAEDAIVVVKGRVDHREDVAKLIAMEMSVPDLSEGPRGPVVVTLRTERCTPPVVERLREVLAAHPGTTEVQLQLRKGERTVQMRVAEGLRVAATPALMGDLKALLGPASVAG
jgi:DNA polymerase-3 subunit alpha